MTSKTATEHKTSILDLSQDTRTIYQATCSCGEWESPNLQTRRSAAQYDARTHRTDVKKTGCAHCGKTVRGAAFIGQDQVCHTDEDGYPDCYRLVTVYHERLGSRK